MPHITQAPLPAWGDMITALMHPTLSESELSAPWRRSGDTAFWLSRSAWSLLVIAKWWQRLTGEASIIVWLPDFFCNASLVPLRGMGAQLQFYPLTNQMAPDLDACRTLATEKPPDLFVLVHFFGHPALAEGAAALCRETGAWLIEDAAHVLRPIPGIGEQGDCVLYSPHKLLPIPDGAVMVVREDGPARLTSHASAVVTFQDAYSSLIKSSGFSNQPAWVWLIKRCLQRLGVRSWRRPVASFTTDADTPGIVFPPPKMSALSRRLLFGLVNTLDSVAYQRKHNRLLWIQGLSEAKLYPSEIQPTAGEYTPYLAEFNFANETLAEEAFIQWQGACLPVTTWPDLPPEVVEKKDRHSMALKLRNTRVYLPVHQSLDYRVISDCVRKI